jgi:hypothetical protein
MITLVDPGRLAAGVYFVDNFANTVNTAVFGQSLVSHRTGAGWWQYAAFYGTDRQVRVGRRLEGGSWQLLTLPITLANDDHHQTLALSVSTVDGRLHLAAGAHNNPMRGYTRTAAGAVDQVPAWNAALFEPPTNTLAGTVIGEMTYPTFTAKPDGGLLFWWRSGISGNGALRLAEYDGTAGRSGAR